MLTIMNAVIRRATGMTPTTRAKHHEDFVRLCAPKREDQSKNRGI